MKKRETVFREKVRRKLKTLKNTWFTSVQQKSISGTPDIIMCVNGKFVALELKTNEGKLSKIQGYNIEQINSSEGYGLVVSPDNFETIFLFLSQISQETL